MCLLVQLNNVIYVHNILSVCYLLNIHVSHTYFISLYLLAMYCLVYTISESMYLHCILYNTNSRIIYICTCTCATYNTVYNVYYSTQHVFVIRCRAMVMKY